MFVSLLVLNSMAIDIAVCVYDDIDGADGDGGGDGDGDDDGNKRVVNHKMMASLIDCLMIN